MSAKSVTQRIRGGVAGVVYAIACNATTAAGLVRRHEGTLQVMAAPV